VFFDQHPKRGDQKEAAQERLSKIKPENPPEKDKT